MLPVFASPKKDGNDGELSSLSGEDNSNSKVDPVDRKQTAKKFAKKQCRSSNNDNDITNDTDRAPGAGECSFRGSTAAVERHKQHASPSNHKKRLNPYYDDEEQGETHKHHPRMEHEEEEDSQKEAAKREYNRLNAARARLRHKTKVQNLQDQVEELQDRSEAMERENAYLRAQLILMQRTTAKNLHASNSTTNSITSNSSMLQALGSLIPQQHHHQQRMLLQQDASNQWSQQQQHLPSLLIPSRLLPSTFSPQATQSSHPLLVPPQQQQWPSLNNPHSLQTLLAILKQSNKPTPHDDSK